MSIVVLRDAVVLLGRFPALSGVDLEIGAAEVVLLQGPNGAGKSTLLRLCAGLLRPHSGTSVVLGHDLSKSRAVVRRSVGLLGHDTALYDDLTVTENLQFLARAARIELEAVGSALDRLGVAARLHDVVVGRLSAGQRRRVALAGVALRRPELWLLDEPHAGLDQGGRDLVDGLVSEAAAGGATVLVASHELDRTLALKTRRVTVAGGTITADVVDACAVDTDSVDTDSADTDSVDTDSVDTDVVDACAVDIDSADTDSVEADVTGVAGGRGS